MRALAPDSRAERDALDEAALGRVLAGDDSGLEELYDRHAPLALGVAARTLRHRSDAEDVVHDAFVAIVERAHQFRADRGTVAGWLIITIRNLALDRGRKVSRRAEITDAALKHEPTEPVADPEALLWLAQRHVAVTDALERLSPAQRRLLETAFFDGLSYPEIAERDGIPLGTVKSRVARALAALRDMLDGDGCPRVR